MPDVTVKAFAELIHTPLYGQLRILNEQKYPKQAPGVFKIQYYRPALLSIRRYFQSGNNIALLPANAQQVTGVGKLDHQRENNFRAISSFRRGTQKNRMLTQRDLQTWELTLANVTLRCTPDLQFAEGDDLGFILFDCREQQQEEEIIRTTIELVHHTLSKNGVQLPMRRVEYVHLNSDTVYRWTSCRQTTIKRATQSAAAIQTLWDSI